MRDIVAVNVRIGHDENHQRFEGRAAWALANLVQAGTNGCTPIDHPGPRWAHYVYLLRKAGIVVETIYEEHFGAYAGRHARYVLRSPVEILREVRA